MSSKPYLIVAPHYTAQSAGVHVMHKLCHDLNEIGEEAYITIYPQLSWLSHESNYLAPDMNTPLLTREILDMLEKEGRQPIVICQENTDGNPLNATNVVRYVMNYIDYFGKHVHKKREIKYAYSRRIAKDMGIPEYRVLFMPVSDDALFTPPPEGSPRSGSCFYAAKYHHFHGKPLFPITDGSTEITRHRPDSQTKQQIAELFRKCELFYTYEDTALAIEAALCGCPTVFLPNELLNSPLGFDDLGMDGFAWGNDPIEIARAKLTVGEFRNNYAAVKDRYWQQLREFVAYTQAQATPMNKRISLLSEQCLHTAIYLAGYLRKHGIKHFVQKTIRFFQKRR